MPFVPTPNTVKVCLRYTQNGQQTCNVFHVDLGTDPGVIDMTAIGALFASWWIAEMKPLTQNATSLDAVEVTDISAPSAEGIVYTTGLPSAGTSGDDSMPNNSTIVTKLASGLTGRSRRGRSYFAGLGRNALNPDRQTVTSTFQGALEDAFIELRDLIIAAGFEWVVTSLISGGVPRTTGLNTPITNAVVNPTLDSQRRRLPERGA